MAPSDRDDDPHRIIRQFRDESEREAMDDAAKVRFLKWIAAAMIAAMVVRFLVRFVL